MYMDNGHCSSSLPRDVQIPHSGKDATCPEGDFILFWRWAKLLAYSLKHEIIKMPTLFSRILNLGWARLLLDDQRTNSAVYVALMVPPLTRAFSFSGLGYMVPVFPAQAGIHFPSFPRRRESMWSCHLPSFPRRRESMWSCHLSSFPRRRESI